MKPTNNGNCKNGDSGHHYWRGVITAPREFHEKVHSRMTHSGQGFWTKSEEKYFRILSCISSIFFYLRESMKNSTEKNDWTALRPETNFVELTTPTLWIQIPEKVWKKKKNPPIGTWAAILEFFDLFTHFGNHTGSQRKKLHFPCQSLSFYYPLIYAVNHHKRMCDVSWIIKGWWWLFSSLKCSFYPK